MTYQTVRLTDPARTEVRDAAGAWLATLTDDCRTVTLAGPERRLAEVSTLDPVERSVTHAVWVRSLPVPFDGSIDGAWLDAALAANHTGEPDLLAAALEYRPGRPLDASYGPLGEDGARAEGSDFHDYLGLDWAFPDGTRTADPAQYRCLDCSGFTRMVLGYRGGVPMSIRPLPDMSTLPRRSFEQFEGGPGVVIIPNRNKTPHPAHLNRLAPGDLLFWDASGKDGKRLDHVGIYLGIDPDGRYRFVSSRKSPDGPTMGDYRGASAISPRGTNTYSTGFRCARRV